MVDASKIPGGQRRRAKRNAPRQGGVGLPTQTAVSRTPGRSGRT